MECTELLPMELWAMILNYISVCCSDDVSSVCKCFYQYMRIDPNSGYWRARHAHLGSFTRGTKLIAQDVDSAHARYSKDIYYKFTLIKVPRWVRFCSNE